MEPYYYGLKTPALIPRKLDIAAALVPNGRATGFNIAHLNINNVVQNIILFFEFQKERGHTGLNGDIFQRAVLGYGVGALQKRYAQKLTLGRIGFRARQSVVELIRNDNKIIMH